MGIKEKIRRIWNTVFIPTSIDPIKFVLLLENIFAVYRNLGYYSKKGRVFIYLRTIFDISCTISSFVACPIIATRIPMVTTSKVVFYMNGTTSIIIIILALVYSKKFSRLLKLIEEIHFFFANDKQYHKNLKRGPFIKYAFFTYNIIAIIAYVVIYIRLLYTDKLPGNALFLLYARMYDYRCIFEHVVIFSILHVMSAQVECITRALSKKVVPGERIIENNETKLELKDLRDMFTVFSNIKKCSLLVNELFGRQLVLMLASATAYCILFLYNFVFFSVRGSQNYLGLTASVLKLFTFFFPLLLVSWGGQQILNKVNDLACQLGKLLIDCDTNDAYYKAMKGFLRLVSTRSIRTKTFGSINVDMTLIPSVIIFVISYTVIALQFTNIV